VALSDEPTRSDCLFVRCSWKCGLCLAVCREAAITSDSGDIGIRRDMCSRCMLCVRLCPVGILREEIFA
jgi:Fe-S-cluster-containing hydrogenase component 2